MADDIRRSEGTEDLLARQYTNDEKYHVLTEESYKFPDKVILMADVCAFADFGNFFTLL